MDDATALLLSRNLSGVSSGVSWTRKSSLRRTQTLDGCQLVLRRLQAEASLRLLESLRGRLMNNALFYDRLCWTRKRLLEDPDDVLIKAEHHKRELAAEQQRQEQQTEEDT